MFDGYRGVLERKLLDLAAERPYNRCYEYALKNPAAGHAPWKKSCFDQPASLPVGAELQLKTCVLIIVQTHVEANPADL